MRRFGNPASLSPKHTCALFTVYCALLLAQGGSSTLVFTKQLYEVNCDESTDINTVILTVNASDSDTGTAGDLAFSINPPNAWFTIDNEGNVKVSSTLDAENPKLPRVVTFVVRADDQSQPSLTATANVAISIIDVNDHRPRWSKSLYTATLTDGDPANSFVIHTSATDGDRDSHLVFKFHLTQSFLAINSSTGEITTTKNIVMSEVLADKGSDNFLVSLRADDGLYVESARVLFLIVDRNNFAPEFNPVVYNVTVEENTSGSDLETVVATDDQEEPRQEITYSLGRLPIPGLLEINGKSGTITLKATLDREGPLGDRLSLLVYAVDDGNPGPVMTGTATLSITVTDVNDNPPRYNADSYNLLLPQMYTSGQRYGLPKATDLDIGENARIEYELTSGGGQTFRLDKDTSEITTVADCGNDCVKTVSCFSQKITVYAKDPVNAAMNDSLDVNIILTPPGFTANSIPDASGLVDCSQAPTPNDHDPSFAETVYEIQVFENVSVNSVIKTLSASDPDRGQSGNVTYSLNSPYLTIGPSGNISTIKEVDFENPSERRICADVTATDLGTPPRSATTTVCMNVMNINDNAPEFGATSYTASVKEGDPPGTSVANITASDKDDDRLRFSLLGQQDYFSINPGTGEITVSKDIDVADILRGSSDDSAYLTVRVTDEVFTKDVTVRVKVVNENRYPPEFDFPVYNVSVEENTSGLGLVTVRATDNREVPHQLVTYLLGNVPSLGLLSINSTSGMVILMAPLDREGPLGDRLSLLVYAVDDGNPGPVMTGTATLSITVTDVNDNPPRYNADSYNLLLPQTYTSGQRYALPTATDLDIGENARIEYELISGGSGAFSLDKDTSEITTVADCGNDCVRTVNCFSQKLRVRAFNPNMPSRNEVLDINVALLRPGDDGNSLQDVLSLVDCSTAPFPNEHPPEFSRQLYEVNITENLSVNHVILVTSASDADGGLSGKVVYTVNSPYFNIGPSGNISSSTMLDFENPSERRLCFQVVATDMGVPSMSATAEVCVAVTNLNDNPPVFNPKFYRVFVEHGDPVGTILTQMSATDEDGMSELRFDLLTTSQYFQVNPTNGELSVSKPINITDLLHTNANEQLVLHVRVTDGTFYDNATVAVMLERTNKHDPLFTEDMYNVTVEEEVSGVTMVTVSAQDADVPPQTLRYYIQTSSASDFFSINPTSGVVMLTKRLDRENMAADYLDLVVMVSDSGKPPPMRSSSTTVRVHVTDINDHVPMFPVDVYNLKMPQDYSSNTSFGLPVARDPDVGDTIHYSISENARDVFLIDPLTGVITTKDGCNDSCARSQDCHLIMFTVWATNPDRPLLNDSMTVNVSLLTPLSPGQTADLISCSSVGMRNKNAPKFEQEFYGKSYSESVPPGTVVLYVSAVDGDPGPEGEIDYFLRGTADFDINAQGGISTLRDMDSQRPADRTLCMLAVARDRGSPSLEGTTTVCLYLNESNSNRPRFTEDRYFTTVVDGTSAGVSLIQVSARDFDKDSEVLYLLETRNLYFALNDRNITVAQKINRDDILQSYPDSVVKLKLVASDGPFRDEAWVYISVFPNNLSCPAVGTASGTLIGILIAGWLLTILLAVFLIIWCRRQKQQQKPSRRGSEYSSYYSNKSESDNSVNDRSLYMSATLTLPRGSHSEDISKIYEPFPMGKAI